MSKCDYTHLALVLDKSGSMTRFESRIKKSITNLLRSQATVPGEMSVSVMLFDHQMHSYDFVPVLEAEVHVRHGYMPGGGTALYDAVGCSARSISSYIAGMPPEEQPEKVLFAIVTDGEEAGHSREFNINEVKEIVEHHESVYGWEFLFIGSNQDAYKVGHSFGIKGGKALSFANTDNGIESAIAAVSGAITRYRKNGAPHANEFFTESDHSTQQGMGAAASPQRS